MGGIEGMGRFFTTGLFLVVLTLSAPVWAYNPIAPEKKAEILARANASPLERKLSDILEKQQRLLSCAEKSPKADLTIQLSELASAYASLLHEYPENTTLLLHYGKFLRLVGEDARAADTFKRVLALDDSVAVAYQQLGNIHAENGRYKEAWPLFQSCIKLAPDVALYQYQMGEFIHVFHQLMEADGLLRPAESDKRMQEAFANAVKLDPGSETLLWRYAQSFYDVHQPDWQKALSAWESAAAATKDPLKEPTLRMHKIRCLIELGQTQQAQALLEKPAPPSFDSIREDLRKRLKSH